MSLKFWKLRLGPCLLPQPASLLCFPPPVPCAARPPRWVAPGQIQLRLRFTWRPHKPLDPLPPCAGAPFPRHAAQNLLAAATSPPPWPEQRSTPDPHLSRASASLEVPQRVPLALSHAPCPVSPNQRRRSSVTPASSTPQRSRHCSSPPPALTP